MVHSNPNHMNELQFGISISQGPYPYTNTTVVTIVPRYVLVNKLEHPLLVKQHLDSYVKDHKPLFLSNEQGCNEMQIHFKKNVKNKGVNLI